MPEIGEINENKVWSACTDCGKERWIELRRGKPKYILCGSCSTRKSQMGEKNNRWNGGRFVSPASYIKVRVYPNDFFYPMVNNIGYVLEHRLIMAKHLGRNLHRWELVHHKNHVRHDNQIENLQLVSEDRHSQITILENRISLLEKRITLLEAENELLKSSLTLAR